MALIDRVHGNARKIGEPASRKVNSSTGQTPQSSQAEESREREKPISNVPAHNEAQAYIRKRPAIYGSLRTQVHERLVEEFSEDAETVPKDVIKAKITELLNIIIREKEITLAKSERQSIAEEIFNDLLGLGPLEDLLLNPDITEIMVNGPDQIYVEQKGRLTLVPVAFDDLEQLLQVIDRIVSSIGRRIDESSPMVDARLQDGSRVNVIIPPLALCGPTVTIRKFAKEAYTVKDLLNFGSVTEDMLTLLRACVRGRLNMIVSGGTGSGKTTTLNILSSYIPDDERIVTIEDAAELQLSQDHVVTLEARPPNVDGMGRIAIRELVVNALRMRPDRIVVGECRGGEALDMLQAMNTGHDGSLTTIHANNPRDCISRLETLVLMSGIDLPARAVREQIVSAVNVIVQTARLQDGTRKVISIAELVGREGEQIKMQDIFVFKQTGIDSNGNVIGKFMPTGVVPNFMTKLDLEGESVSPEIFQQRT